MLGFARPAPAQTAPLTVPPGSIRIDLGAGVDSWNDLLPGSGQQIAIVAAQTTRLSGALGLAIGLSSRFTLFGTIPFERLKVQAEPVDPAIDVRPDRAGGLGDVGAGVALRLLGPAAAAPGGTRVEIVLLTRFATGSILRSGQFYTLTSGAGRSELEAGARLHMPAGRVGVRLDGRYAVPIGENDGAARSDGRLALAAAPWIQISRSLAFEAPVEVLLRSDADGGTATSFGGGLAYYAVGRVRSDGRRGMPLGAWWRVTKLLADGGAPEPISVTAGIQLYYGLFR